MNDPLSKTVEVICKEAESNALQIFTGYLAEESKVPSVHWNSDHGGNWKQFVGCAKAFDALVLYVNWAPFEQFQIDDSVSALELACEDGDENEESKRQIAQIRAFQTKVGLTCVIDLAFLANGVIHIYQETADWFDEFSELIPDDNDDDEAEEPKPINKSDLRRWATALASDPKYCTSTQREYLLQQIAGAEFPKLPAYQILREAEPIYQTEFRQAAEEKLANEIQEMRNQGFNLKAIGLKLGISQGRVSGIVSLMAPKKKSPA
jgi:hypothetical protein